MDLLHEFLDAKSLIFFSQTNQCCAKLSNKVISQKLAAFSPYFVTPDWLINKLLLFVLLEHFKDSRALTLNPENPVIQDDLQVLIIKFCYGHLRFDVIPRNIYIYLISFVYEAINGHPTSLPVSIKACKIELVRKMRSFALEKSFAYITEKTTVENSPKWKRNLAFFHSQPDKAQVMAHFAIPTTTITMEIMYNLALEPEFDIAIAEVLQDPLKKMDPVYFGLVSGSFHWNAMNRELLIAHVSKLSQEFLHFIFKTFYLPVENKAVICSVMADPPESCAFYTSSLVKELPSNQFHLIDAGSMFRWGDRVSLYHLNLFASVIDSETPLTCNEAAFMISKGSYVYFECLIKESKQPWRLARSLFVIPEIRRKLYHAIKSIDPLLLFAGPIDISNMNNAANMTYCFDASSPDRVKYREFLEEANHSIFLDRTVTFHQILTELK